MERHAGAGRGNGRVFRKHARALLSRVPESKIWKKARTRSSGWQTRPWITRPAFVSARPLQGRTRDEEPKIFSRQETRALAGTQRAFECRLRARQKRLEMLSFSYNCNSCSARIKLSLSMSDCASRFRRWPASTQPSSLPTRCYTFSFFTFGVSPVIRVKRLQLAMVWASTRIFSWFSYRKCAQVRNWPKFMLPLNLRYYKLRPDAFLIKTSEISSLQRLN